MSLVLLFLAAAAVETAPPVAGQTFVTKEVCRSVPVSGSRFPKKVCRKVQVEQAPAVVVSEEVGGQAGSQQGLTPAPR